MARRYNFSQADRWAAKVKQRLNYLKVMVPARIIQAQQRERSRGGRMPVDTGELRDSLIISVGGTWLVGGESYRQLPTIDAYGADEITWGWTAPYANRINYGFTGFDSIGRYYNQAGVHFIEYGQGLAPRIARDEAVKASRME